MDARRLQFLLLLPLMMGQVDSAQATPNELLAALRARHDQMAQFYRQNRKALGKGFELVSRILSARTFYNLPLEQQRKLRALKLALGESVSAVAAEEFESKRAELDRELAPLQAKVDSGIDPPPEKVGRYLYLSLLKEKWFALKADREEAPRLKRLRRLARRADGASDEEMLWNYLHARHHITLKVTRDTCLVMAELLHINCPRPPPSPEATRLDTLERWIEEASFWRRDLQNLGYAEEELEGITPRALTVAKE